MKKTLIATYSLFILFLVGSAIFAAYTFDGDVDNAYEKGMQYPVELAKIKKLGWHFSLTNQKIYNRVPGQIELLIQDREGKPVLGADVSMELSLLTKPQTLPRQKAAENRPGHYSISVVPLSHGFWQVDANIIYHEELMHHQFKIYIEEGS